MERGSLRLRLIAAWAVFILLTLQASAIGLRVLFERSILRRTIVELGLDLRQVATGLEVQPNGSLKLMKVLSDPQFGIPNSGRYWQVARAGRPLLRSASLSNFELDPLQAPVTDEGTGEVRIEGPQGQQLLGLVRSATVANDPVAGPLVVTTAVDYAEIRDEVQKFGSDILVGLGSFALLMLIAAWTHVSVGLRPLKALSTQLSAVRSGSYRRLEGDFPIEVMPLVSETNALLDAQDAALKSARARAADLAHGLKTPLAVMSTQSRLLRKKGEGAIADQIDKQVEAMRHHVERELVRARARGPGATLHLKIDVCEVVHELVGALQLIGRGGSLRWTIEAPPSLMLGVDRADLNDIVGNLLDNAMKWARTEIRIRLLGGKDSAEVVVEDDGPGIPAEDIARVLRRGERADLSVPGTGLGLSIVNDLAELYRGRLDLERSAAGGLRAAIVLPRS